MSIKQPLLLGVGNILLSDEGIGVRVIEEFERRYTCSGLDILDGGTAGMELLDDLSKRSLVIIVDAIKSEEPPGTIRLLANDQVPIFFAQKLSPHQLGLSDVLSALLMIDEFPEQLFLLGVVPESLEPGIGLTAALTERVPEVLKELKALLQSQGVQLES